MDWKTYYRDEMLQPETKAYLEGMFAASHETEEADIFIQRGAILSFPHTAACYIGPLQTRVVSALYRCRIKRVIALGVLHTSTLPAPYDELYRTAVDDGGSSSERLKAFAALRGGFVPDCRVIKTVFGEIPCEGISQNQAVGVRTDGRRVLKNEFSLDSFFSLMSLYAKVHRMLPITVLPVYVGMTRDPMSGSFDVADDLADTLRSIWDSETAIVTTGDIMHYGTAYTPAEKMLNLEEEQLEPFFRRECERILSLAVTKQDLDGAFRDSNEILRSDQRYILPAIAKYLGQNAESRILSFSLCDYSQILETARPCIVASALVAYVPPPNG